MELLIEFFETIPSSYRTGVLAGGITLFWLLESAVPLFKFDYRKWRHAGINLTLTALQLVVGFSFAAVLVAAADFSTAKKFGLLYLVELPLWLHVVLAVLLLDLIGAWFIHWLEHRVKWMWRFHLVHHTDTTVDVTTGLRHHPAKQSSARRSPSSASSSPERRLGWFSSTRRFRSSSRISHTRTSGYRLASTVRSRGSS